MSLKSLVLILLLSVCHQLDTFATDFTPNARVSIETSRLSVANSSEEAKLNDWLQRNRESNRVSFPTRTGFILLRKEEILSLKIDKLYGGLLLQYWKKGEVKTVNCQSTISQAIKSLGEYPFLKASRSSIVNMNEVEEYVGTRRDAHLVLRDGSTMKISRNRAALIHDWFSSFSINNKV